MIGTTLLVQESISRFTDFIPTTTTISARTRISISLANTLAHTATLHSCAYFSGTHLLHSYIHSFIHSFLHSFVRFDDNCRLLMVLTNGKQNKTKMSLCMYDIYVTYVFQLHTSTYIYLGIRRHSTMSHSMSSPLFRAYSVLIARSIRINRVATSMRSAVVAAACALQPTFDSVRLWKGISR